MKEILELIRRIQAAPERAAAELQAFVDGRAFPIADEHMATFFFWDGKPTHTVHLIHWVFGLESRQELQRIEGTDAFFLPLELPFDGRVEYKFELQRDYQTHLVRDPLNARLAMDPFGYNSVCPMSGYQEPTWVFPEIGARPGRMVSFELNSAAWGDRRKVQVLLPAEYRAGKTYPLMIVHDGSDYLRFATMKTVIDNLIARHEVIPMVVAFIDGSAHRNAEYGANPRQVQFVVDEVLPALRKRYSVSTDPEDTGIMGASFGGVSSLFIAWSRPGVFGRVLLQSGSFLFTDVGHHDRGPLWDPVAAFVNAFRTDPGRVAAQIYMSCGTFESLIYYNRSLVPLLRAQRLNVRFVEARDGHNWIAWRDRLREGLTFLFPGHLWMVYE